MDYQSLIVDGLKTKVKSKDVTLESSFKDLGIDSLDLVDFVFELETELEITFEDDELMSLKTVQDVVGLVNKKKA